MLSNWFAQPEGSGHSSADEARVGDNDEDTQVVEPDQGNGKSSTDAAVCECSDGSRCATRRGPLRSDLYRDNSLANQAGM